ncbi:hypothetical protein THAOC_02863 [Thalassiosira oceanica]|uniref:Uncharacterized protein n=1 Tax=Thalassiosira oceanica TaxID=159749 RepID=K0TQ46_THAOC|nr:hypothetical protein THAOC_02863 [Thalassiosira oceanica]|eukprot:EJK75412.1 hypothetical protein THAOC_02863 [Thalassiosira oceanica]
MGGQGRAGGEFGFGPPSLRYIQPAGAARQHDTAKVKVFDLSARRSRGFSSPSFSLLRSHRPAAPAAGAGPRPALLHIGFNYVETDMDANANLGMETRQLTITTLQRYNGLDFPDMFYSAEPSDEEDEAVDENEEYTACYEATIDDCINSLHTPAHYTAAELSRRDIEFEYDWLLDGSEDEDEGPLNKTKRRRQRRYGDSDLDQTICMLELEHASYTSSTGGSTCVSVGENSVNDNDSASSGHEETIEFIGIGAQTAAAGFANFADFSALDQPDEVLQRDVLYEYVEKKEPHEENDNANQLQTNCQVRSFIDGYNPPQSIECLVETLESELDVTIKTCLSVAENQDSDMVELDRVAHESQVSQVDVQCAPKESNEESAQRQSSSLMSDVLLKTLPLPMPNSTSDDRVASFTRRLQNEHCSSSAQTGLYDDDALERKLSRTIYSGYFDDSSSTQKSDQDKDVHSIVLDEILSVPWPFHQIDLDNSIFSNEHSESDSDSQNCLDFDPYISNRLSELDSAFRDVMEVAAARVGKKEETLNHEVNLVFDSLMQVETALMFIAETRKLVLSASQGYTVEDSVHDVISCRMDVVRFAEKKEILQDLLDAIDHVSIVKEREADWWHRLQRGEPFESMVNDTRQLLVMIEGEESLVRLSCLEPMRLRIRELPHLLLQTIEESLTSFLGTIISAQEKIDFDRAKNQYLGLFRSWCLCYRMILDILPSGVKAETIKAEWLTTYLRAFRFHIRRATACAVIDSFGDENVKSAASDVGAAHDLGAQLDQSKLDSVVDSLCQRLFELRFTTSSDGNALSSTFYHLCSRHVEILSLHSTILRWHGSKDGGISDSSGNSVSSVSSTSSSCTEGSTLSQDSEAPPVPGGLQFAFIDVQSVLRSNQTSLYISCEESILSFAEGYMEMKESGNLLVSDATTDSLSSIHGISKQFQDFALHFFRNNDDDSRSSGIQPSKSCAIEDCLAKLYDSHLRSVHIEAMKTTGTLLRHEPWQLSPIELNSGSRTADPTLRTYEVSGLVEDPFKADLLTF